MAWVRPPGPLADGMRIGLLGGSFNPAHAGHLHVSEVARKTLGLDQVWWLVTPGNPLKRAHVLADVPARMAGAAAIGRTPHIRVTDLESRLGTRFTIDTVTALQRRFPGICFVWLMGGDNLQNFSRWKDWAGIARRIPIAVVRRPGFVMAALKAPLVRRFGLARRFGPPPRIMLLDGPRRADSSTALRDGRVPLEPRLPAC